jgi:DNA-binding IclR family transcriptional regulator
MNLTIGHAKTMDVKTAGRTLEIFESFAQSQGPLSLSEIARALNAPLSSTLYLVRALEDRGYLYAVMTRRIYPTRKLLDVATAVTAGESWIGRVEPVLLALRDTTQETVILGKRHRNRVIYLAVFEGPQTIRYSTHVGDLKPLHATAIGKALLGALEPAERKKLLTKLPLVAATAKTVTDSSKLLKELENTAARGYSITRGEHVVDVMATAKSIQLGNDRYGVAIAGPLYRMSPVIDSHVKHLIKACREITGGSASNMVGVSD